MSHVGNIFSNFYGETHSWGDLRARIEQQWKHPEGTLGRLVGWLMHMSPSQRERNFWTITLLNIQPTDHVLEFGCGPGFALGLCLSRASEGRVVGADHSSIMIEQARRRYGGTPTTNRLDLRCCDVGAIVGVGEHFDKVFGVDVVQFIENRCTAFRALYAVTAPCGVIAATCRPRDRVPTRQNTAALGEAVRADMITAGYRLTWVEEMPVKRAPAVCVLGIRLPPS